MQKKAFSLGSDDLNPKILKKLAHQENPDVAIEEKTWQLCQQKNSELLSLLDKDKKIYGITTGFGSLSNKSISKEDRCKLQTNLLRSHACGLGKKLSLPETRALLIVKLHNLLAGPSGISPACLKSLYYFLNHNILAEIPEQGSVGASGDLAPLSHLALPLIAEGKVYYQGELIEGKKLYQKIDLLPYNLAAKEGLSLINGTQFISAVGSLAAEQARILAASADIIAALSLLALRGSREPFDPRISQVKPHPGQIAVAKNVLKLLSDADYVDSLRPSHLQDPYCLRCIPQVHGASRDTIDFATQKLTIELNSSTDNPIIIDDETVLHGGNFHGQAVAIACDTLAIAVSELASISEQRIARLVGGYKGALPDFLSANSGLNCGFMILHVAAAALVSENKILSHPASVDNIPTSAAKEDHVSMGPIAARKAREINTNASHCLAIELLAACQALDLKPVKELSSSLKLVYNEVRSLSPKLEGDRSLSSDIERVSDFIQTGALEKVVEK